MTATATLMKRVNSHLRGQMTNGQDSLSLTRDCIDHMFGESGDWSPLALLIGKSEPAQSKMIRKITGQVVEGFILREDKEQPSGLRFLKSKDQTQQINQENYDALAAFVEAKRTIQAQDVKERFTVKKEAPEKTEKERVESRVKSAVKWSNDHGIPLTTLIHALQVEAKAQAETQRTEEALKAA